VPPALASGNTRVVSTATLDSYTAGDPGTCDSTYYLPIAPDPACVATVGELYDAFGDFEGTLRLELTFTAFPDASDQFSDFQLWTGTIGGYGTGSFEVLEYDGITKSDGTYTSKLKVVEGTGTGDFGGVTGMGTSAGDLTSGTNTLKLKLPKN
jgi:Protein of unknown function (DUF3224)